LLGKKYVSTASISSLRASSGLVLFARARFSIRQMTYVKTPKETPSTAKIAWPMLFGLFVVAVNQIVRNAMRLAAVTPAKNEAQEA